MDLLRRRAAGRSALLMLECALTTLRLHSQSATPAATICQSMDRPADNPIKATPMRVRYFRMVTGRRFFNLRCWLWVIATSVVRS